MFAKVISAEPVGKKVRLVLGDETATIRSFIFNDEGLDEGNTVVLFKASAPVTK